MERYQNQFEAPAETVATLWRRHGYSPRKHIGHDLSWPKRLRTVVDLSRSEHLLWERQDIEKLIHCLAQKKQWLFPAMEISAPLPFHPDTLLADGNGARAVVVAPGQGQLRRAAQRLIREVKRRCGLELPLVRDDACEWDVFRRFSVILFGGSHENRLSREIALRRLCGVADALVPGPGGHMTIVYVGLVHADNNVILLAGDHAQLNSVADRFARRIRCAEGRVVFPYCHAMQAGAIMRRRLGSWPKYLAWFLDQTPTAHPALTKISLPAGPELAAARVARALDSGGLQKNYTNNRPLATAIQAAHFFMATGDLSAARYFRAMLFRLADYYLKTPGGASIPSDFDFYAGPLTHYFGLLEHLTIFSDADRLLLANLLLACMRSVRTYYACTWEPMLKRDYRQNHQTFATRSLFLAAAYFARHGIPDAREWQRTADRVFSGAIWRRTKFEHSAGYEPLVFEHAACYSAFHGKQFTMFKSSVLRQAARRQMITTDNFFRLTDLGDSPPPMAPCDPSDILAVISTLTAHEPELAWFAHKMAEKNPRYLPWPIYMLTGLRSAAPGRVQPCAAWEKAPLNDSRFSKIIAPRLRAHAFDRIAWRTGWETEDQYLLLDGFGHAGVSHSHRSANGLLRYNHLGRHWLISNGYGRQSGCSNVHRSYRTREIGPRDHNMLVLMQAGEPSGNLSPAVLTALGSRAGIAWATSVLTGYAGVSWQRTLIVAAHQWLLVIDRIVPTTDMPISGHIEWNCLGRVKATANGWRLEQDGVYLHVLSSPAWPSRVETQASGDWHRILKSRQYPHAPYPPRKLVFEIPVRPVPPMRPRGRAYWLATLFMASRRRDPAIHLHEEIGGKTGRFKVEGKQVTLRGPTIRANELRINGGHRMLEVCIDALIRPL